ncbi:hypothetical protein SeLEV6574_g06987 [Synchytrium endobioticum]|uniref:C2 domain-containing protein n=1 Tax=Synchytrium endobioticum TaxID=286115 RepID=A0A507CJ84_9FUNG|nr:hypothetical protein SeLEV6574_g06987 [Synchytrium endobioticum]
MWGFGRASSSSPSSSSNNRSPANNKNRALDTHSNLDLYFGGLNLHDDTGLDDPELLAELEAMTIVTRLTAPKQPVAATTTQAANDGGPSVAQEEEQLVEITLPDLSDVLDDAEPNVHITDQDLQDPDLLAELFAVTGTGSGDSSGSTASHADQNTGAISSTINSGIRSVNSNNGNGTSVTYQVPAVDNALITVAPIQPPKSEPSTATTPNATLLHSSCTFVPPPRSESITSVSIQSIQPAQSPPSVTTQTPNHPLERSLQVKLQSKDPQVISQYIQAEKVNAVNRKRAGDIKGALESRDAFRALEARLSQIQNTSKVPLPLISCNSMGSASSSVNNSPVNPVPHQTQLQQDTTLHNSPTKASVDKRSGVLSILQQRQDDYKKAALTYRDAQNLVKAQEMLSVYKSLNGAIATVKRTGDLPTTFQLPPPPSSSNAVSLTPTAQVQPVSTVSPNKSSTSGKPKVSTMSLKKQTPSSPVFTAPVNISPVAASSTDASMRDVWQYLAKTLQSQVSLGSSLASRYLKAGRKDLASEFHKLGRDAATDLSIVMSLPQQPESKPPFFTYKNVTYEYEHVNTDIPAEELEITIIAGHGLGTRLVRGEEVCAYTMYDIGWPTDANGAVTAHAKGETPIANNKSANPVFNFKKNVTIEKSRAFQRYLERRSATFDVMHSRGMSLIWRPICLGRANVPVAGLLKSAEVHESVELVDPENSRRRTGGRLEVRFRMRQAFLGPELISKSHRWLTLDSKASNAMPTAPHKDSNDALTELSPNDAARQSSSQSPSPRISSPRVSAEPLSVANAIQPSPDRKAAPSPTPVAAAAVIDDSDMDALEMRFMSADSTASNAVVEAEHNQIATQINSLKAQRKVIPEELVDREREYQMRMELLVTLVSVGQLTMSAYIAQVKESIKSTRAQAVAFKKGGRVDLAKKALIRVHIMENEVKEVEDAQNSQDAQ